jgi:hypothetical protein
MVQPGGSVIDAGHASSLLSPRPAPIPSLAESPAMAIADFYMDRVRPIVEAEGEPTNKPERCGEPLAFYRRR